MKNREAEIPDFKSIQVSLASPDKIREWSYGEVTKPETINYRSFKPEKNGLFCEKIFGPVKDWECACNKYKRIRYRGVICDRCGVEVTLSRVRRERMGHVELAVPVSHIWFFKGLPSRIGHLLGMTIKDLERVLYYESYLVTDVGNTTLEMRELISEERYYELLDEGFEFEAKMGAAAVKDLLQQIELEELAIELRDQIANETSQQRKADALKRLRVTEAFRNSENDPSWMILDVIPVLPPDLRPLVPLEGGRFATSDLNDLYRRIINRNNRLRKLIEIKAPEVILRNEKRMLQEAVDALFDNGRRSRAVRGHGNRPLKSLSDMLKGKQGRFRQNLLGKRVDYSGRSVIVVGPELKLHECGLPKSMALELFKPFIIRKLEEKGYVETVKSARKLVERQSPEVWDILEEIIQDHPVLLNRAPTLHRLGIQAFQPVLVEGKAIRIHPLVCQAFNADFDGDQMAVHVPLSFEAQLECRVLMMSANNILLPSSGKPVAAPHQDMVLGSYYLTKEKPGEPGEGMHFGSTAEVLQAMDHGAVTLHSVIQLKVGEEWLETTPGRVVLNECVSPKLGFVNELMDKKNLGRLVGRAYKVLDGDEIVTFLDDLKDLGFHYATLAGVTIGIDDLIIPPEKEKILDSAQKEVDKIHASFENKKISEAERYNRIIDRWTQARESVADAMMREMKEDRKGFNPVFMMAHSGSRGSRDQISQLAGMRGLMAKPQKKMTGQIGEIIEQPIKSNFREGLSVLQYFISTHGARKGLADTALKTADAGYLTRRLVDVAQDVIITEEDCGTIRGLDTEALKEGEEVIETLADRIEGRVLADDAYDPLTGDLLIGAGTLVDDDLALKIENAGIESVKIRSVLTCETRRGVCRSCYGRNLGTNRLVDIGEAVGVVAAQSIGEPGTQLTLRTFHIGGIAAGTAQQTEKIAPCDARVEFVNVRTVLNQDKKHVVIGHKGEILIKVSEGKKERVRARYNAPYGAVLDTKSGAKVKEGQPLFVWDPYADPMVATKKGEVQFIDITPGRTLKEETDEKGRMQAVIKEDISKELYPEIKVLNPDGKVLEKFYLPTGAILQVKDGKKIPAGTSLIKVPKDIGHSGDITGGLPRVVDLVEVRKPKDSAVVTAIDGTVSIGGVTRGQRKVLVKRDEENQAEYLIPQGKHMLVHDGDEVTAGDRLTDGPVNPFDILTIRGVQAAQSYLLNEIQEVYRLQGVGINDKHIEVIVRQMLRKVQVENSGETRLLEGDQVERAEFQDENERMAAEGKEMATYRPLLLGITKASLTTESFISAASFQETTRVLTEAAIHSKKDELHGLKENVIMGRLIPAGTGRKEFRDVDVSREELSTLEEEIALRKAEEAEAEAAAAAQGTVKLGQDPSTLGENKVFPGTGLPGSDEETGEE
ncbi:MAG: DNA-directed RNA polymerase subunit beta' [Candidatus Krumholzibacteria bacterium]|jgi:DNA-directed RNA polymerase subunit beta'|nr:DNA-directed RNA polymerase subunit beta' [Candidatus Krumholzibacteria bacterium]MDP6669483.1 DNA-directed RNA polymerase subunit beta' [Candidatus Krumholzibacteria bacterium]MDP7022586.1 DNA-directed RNA polymerase subunit beta' [Candidatus Krumholzibacteria bacterium]